MEGQNICFPCRRRERERLTGTHRRNALRERPPTIRKHLKIRVWTGRFCLCQLQSKSRDTVGKRPRIQYRVDALCRSYGHGVLECVLRIVQRNAHRVRRRAVVAYLQTDERIHNNVRNQEFPQCSREYGFNKIWLLGRESNNVW